MNYVSRGKSPRIHPEARVAHSAVISGDVEIGPNCYIGHHAVIVDEGGPIRIGAHCVVMDSAVIRGVPNLDTVLGDHVLVGPRAHLVGCRVDSDVFLATGATVFSGAHLGEGAEVRINGVVHLRTTLPAHATVPIGWVAVGTPARILPAEQHDDIWAIQKPLDFPRFVFGMERPPAGVSMMAELMPRYARSLRACHADDHLVCDEQAG